MHPIHKGTVFMGKEQCSTNGVGTTKYSHAKAWSWTPTLHSIQKLTHTRSKGKHCRILRRKQSKSLWPGVSQFLKYNNKTYNQQKKKINLSSSKLKCFVHRRTQSKKTSKKWEIFVNHMPDKGVVSKICEEFITHQWKAQFKNDENIWIFFQRKYAND